MDLWLKVGLKSLVTQCHSVAAYYYDVSDLVLFLLVGLLETYWLKEKSTGLLETQNRSHNTKDQHLDLTGPSQSLN